MAFKMRSPLNNKPIATSNINKGNAPQSSFKGRESTVENTFEVKEEDGNVEVEDKITDSNTGAEDNMDGDRLDAADKAIEKIDKEEGSGNELYDYNPAMYARRKARKDKRDIRRKQREARIVARQYGVEEGRRVDASNTGPRSMEEATYENPEMRDKRLEQERKDKEMQEKMDQAEQRINALTTGESPSPMTPNRAGRPANANLLMTAPVIMTDKHSMKDAVSKLKIKKIAQSE